MHSINQSQALKFVTNEREQTDQVTYRALGSHQSQKYFGNEREIETITQIVAFADKIKLCNKIVFSFFQL